MASYQALTHVRRQEFLPDCSAPNPLRTPTRAFPHLLLHNRGNLTATDSTHLAALLQAGHSVAPPIDRKSSSFTACLSAGKDHEAPVLYQLVEEFVQLHDRQISKTPHQFDLVLDGWSATRKLS